MQNNNSIDALWELMSQEAHHEFVKRLFLTDSPIKVFATFKHPESICGIAFSYNKKLKVSIDSFRNLKELNIQLFADSTNSANRLLSVQLSTDSNKDVFAYLCDNLIDAIQYCDTERNAIKIVLNRLEKWKIMFNKGASDGLGITEQQGLYGELHYLQKLISKLKSTYVETLMLWVGSSKSMRDFQGKEWAVEVKTISANNSNQLTINGERQLDETLLNKLFLYQLSVEATTSSGTTLNEKVDEIRRLLHDDVCSMNVFNSKLMEAGYFDHHREMYENRCYKIRKENYFKIEDTFPRIKESELRTGVSNIIYTINVSNCSEYLVTENEHFDYINNSL